MGWRRGWRPRAVVAASTAAEAMVAMGATDLGWAVTVRVAAASRVAARKAAMKAAVRLQRKRGQRWARRRR